QPAGHSDCWDDLARKLREGGHIDFAKLLWDSIAASLAANGTRIQDLFAGAKRFLLEPAADAHSRQFPWEVLEPPVVTPVQTGDLQVRRLVPIPQPLRPEVLAGEVRVDIVIGDLAMPAGIAAAYEDATTCVVEAISALAKTPHARLRV